MTLTDELAAEAERGYDPGALRGHGRPLLGTGPRRSFQPVSTASCVGLLKSAAREDLRRGMSSDAPRCGFLEVA